MVANALALTPHCLDYLGELSNLPVLRFCAVPQVMAIATLGAVFRNPKVFSGVVKVSSNAPTAAHAHADR